MYFARQTARSEKIDLNHHTYHLRRWGNPNAPLLVLLHGWMDASPTFQFMVDALQEDWNIVAPDWRGFGHSAWNAGSYYFPDYLADLDALLTHLSPNAPVLVAGHSMGSMVAALYAGIRPERVARLVSIEGFGLADASPEDAPARYARWLHESAHAPHFAPVASLEAFAERLVRRNPNLPLDHALFLAHTLTEPDGQGRWRHLSDPKHKIINPILYRLEEAKACWRAIRCPVLWIVGAGQSDHPLAHGVLHTLDERATCFADLQRVDIPNAGHMVQQEKPLEVAAALEAFMRLGR